MSSLGDSKPKVAKKLKEVDKQKKKAATSKAQASAKIDWARRSTEPRRSDEALEPPCVGPGINALRCVQVADVPWGGRPR